MAKQTFTASQVLTAAQMNTLQANDYNWTVDTKTDSYVLVAGDAGKRIVMNAATAKTITVNTNIFTAGDIVWIHNINTGTCTVTAGTATVNTAGSLALAQWEGGALYATSASSFIFFRGGSNQFLVADYLLIAGGGGGGNGVSGSWNGGGGGAGAYRTSYGTNYTGNGQALAMVSAENPIALKKGVTYTITVGGGGASNTDGNNSSIAGTGLTTITAVGGGYGSGTNATSIIVGGGSGGGGRGGVTTNVSDYGTPGQGYQGAAGEGSGSFRGGGGGGAGEAGNTDGATQGGDGLSSDINGSATTRGGGGGGGAATGNGGDGGGGAGSMTTGSAGTANTGGGGGGGSGTNNGGAGGSGVCIIRYLTDDAKGFNISATVGTSSTTGNYTIWTFNGTGTLVVA